MAVLATKALTYYYFEDRNIFADLDLEFERGKVYVILGASGSGKTTLLSLLGGLDTPKGGEILFEGKNIAEMGLEKYRHNCVSLVRIPERSSAAHLPGPKQKIRIGSRQHTAHSKISISMRRRVRCRSSILQPYRSYSLHHRKKSNRKNRRLIQTIRLSKN